ncbi:MAG: M48 family metalloprotease [Fimbriimonas sp.]|nr:M48 family metalloprotease [Fimbriimonas sp.]
MVPALLAVILSQPMRPQPSVDELVNLAWQQADKADAKTVSKTDVKAELQHQQDLKADVELGAKYAIQVEKQSKLSTDTVMINRVQRVGAEIADLANQTHSIATWGDKRFNTFNYTFKVIENDEPNAFSLPGGYVYVQTGLLKFIESDDELAGVLAHEVSHAKFRHIATLQKEESKMSAITLPLILASILTGGGENAGAAITGTQILSTAVGNGWSVKAEEAADYGGIQLMVKSHYNPTGMLTVMERLALVEDSQPQFSAHLGIFRDHPPSKERADSMQSYLKQYNIPVERSKVSISFRAIVKPDDKIAGAVDISFDGHNLVSFAGNDALTRADLAAAKLNTFIDSTPATFEVGTGLAGAVLGGNQALFQFQPEDATAQGKSIADLQKLAVLNIRGALYTVNIRIWETH